MGNQSQKYHQILAQYFETRWREPCIRAINELPTQLIKAENWNNAIETLSSFEFNQLKCEANMVDDLVNDFNQLLKSLNSNLFKGVVKEPIDAWLTFIRSHAHILRKNTEPFIQVAINYADDGPIVRGAEERKYSIQGLLLRKIKRPEFSKKTPLIALYENTWINKVKISADGKLIVSACKNGFLNIINLELNKWDKVFSAQVPKIISFDITPDGLSAITIGENGLIKWDLHTGKCLLIIKECHDFRKVAITSDAKMAVTTSVENYKTTIKVWNLESSKCINTIVNNGYVHSLSLSPNGMYVAIGKEREENVSEIQYWELKSGDCIQQFRLPKTKIERVFSWDLSISSDGVKLISAHKQDGFCLWDLETKQLIKSFASEEDINCVAMASNCCLAISGGGDTTILTRYYGHDFSLYLWNLQTGDIINKMTGHSAEIISLDISADGNRAVSVSKDGTLRVWDLGSDRISEQEGHMDLILDIVLNPNGDMIATASKDGTIGIWDTKSIFCFNKLIGHKDEVTAISITPDGSRIISGGGSDYPGADSSIYLWDFNTYKIHNLLESNLEAVDSFVLTPDGRFVISSYWTKKILLWDLESSRCLRNFRTNEHVMSIQVTPDSKIAITGNWGNTNAINLWKINVLNQDQNLPLENLLGHKNAIEKILVLPDGRQIISCSQDRTIRLWDLKSGKCLKCIEYEKGVQAIALFPSNKGQLVVGGYSDGSIIIWDLPTGNKLLHHYCDSFVKSLIIKNNQVFSGIGFGRLDSFLIENSFPVDTYFQTTATRIWRFEKPGKWDDNITAFCGHCRQRFHPNRKVFDVINNIKINANLSLGQSPCREFPYEAWDEPGLLSECSKCHKPIKFNPFIVDNSIIY